MRDNAFCKSDVDRIVDGIFVESPSMHNTSVTTANVACGSCWDVGGSLRLRSE